MRCRLSFCKRLVAVGLLADGQASRRLTSDSQLLTSWRRGSGAMNRRPSSVRVARLTTAGNHSEMQRGRLKAAPRG